MRREKAKSSRSLTVLVGGVLRSVHSLVGCVLGTASWHWTPPLAFAAICIRLTSKGWAFSLASVGKIGPAGQRRVLGWLLHSVDTARKCVFGYRTLDG
mmetsp:Transcript_15180/g.24654  ORF Transcript_15180/g.24654 Transcript_15180/m.24654 type:complete len:98 (+) Transcript_15180:1382-1675(+)